MPASEAAGSLCDVDGQQPRPEAAVPVAFVSSHGSLAGSERYLSLLLGELDPPWVRTVVCLQDGPFAAELREAGYATEVIDTGARLPAILGSALRLRRLLRRSGARVVHANGVKAAVVAAAATLGSRIPVVWFKHDVSRDGWQARLLARRCARVVATSSALTATFGREVNGKIEVLPYQLPEPRVDVEEARRRVLDALRAQEPVTVLTLVGRLDPFKGHGEVLAAAPGLLARAPGTRFLFVGGPDPAHPGREAEVRREIAERGLERAVLLTGFRSDAHELIAGSDALVVPSVADASGMGMEAGPYVALEALALATPVVGYDHGGLPELVGECGLLVQPHDRAALEETLLRLIEDPALRAELAACGQRRFRERFVLRTLGDDVKRQYLAAAGMEAR
jgi:glycosyltransferase involved in cell wall biosynthesis